MKALRDHLDELRIGDAYNAEEFSLSGSNNGSTSEDSKIVLSSTE
jgi:hypothetical protein